MAMKYVVDQMLNGLAKELRAAGVDCDTATKVAYGNEDSRVSVPDPDLLKYVYDARGTVTLITLDGELAEYCRKFGLPVIRVNDLVVNYIRKGSV